MMEIACSNCKRPYPGSGVPYRCLVCGGLFDYVSWPAYDPIQNNPRLPGIWRFQHVLGLPEKSPIFSLGEGNTPLVWANVNGVQVAFKCEFQNPTGSFKDRGSLPIVSFLGLSGITEAVEDSSGNAGASFAAYSARAGIKACIYIPDTTSGPKRWQIEAYGAEVIQILGPRSNTAEAVRKAASQGAVYASHAYLPFNLPGYATIAYEIVEQLNSPPGTVFIPAGQGGLLLGIGRGFEAMCQSGFIPQMPVLVGVQAMACAPLWALHAYGPAGLGFVTEGQTAAEGIRVHQPLRGDAVLRMIEKNAGRVLAIDEDGIISGRDQLALKGFYVEATSAVVWDAMQQLMGSCPEPWVAVLTGSGMKTTR